MIVTCEAFALADKLGLDRQKMFDVVSTSSGASWSITAYCPAPGIGPESPADNGYKPGFAAELMLKDLRLSQQAAIGADARHAHGARWRRKSTVVSWMRKMAADWTFGHASALRETRSLSVSAIRGTPGVHFPPALSYGQENGRRFG